MKKILLLFISLSSICFAASDFVWKNLFESSRLSKENKTEDAIEYLSNLIDSENVSPIDKVHYIIKRSNIYCEIDDRFGYFNSVEQLDNLCSDHPECRDELFIHYCIYNLLD